MENWLVRPDENGVHILHGNIWIAYILMWSYRHYLLGIHVWPNYEVHVHV